VARPASVLVWVTVIIVNLIGQSGRGLSTSRSPTARSKPAAPPHSLEG